MKRTWHDRLGTRIAGTYRLDRIIGRGGMGVVFAGEHVRTSRPVAVKLLSPEDAAARARFLREATIVGKTDHPNVVGVIDVGEEDGTLYIVLELLSGEPLSRFLSRHRRLSPTEALDVALPIIDALAFLHEAGVIHRDIKPANVFLAIDGVGSVVPKLLDFGISRTIERGETSLTTTGALLGTPEYMSPEQVRSENAVGPESDVWSVGVVLYECLSGEKPFVAATVGGVIARIVSERPHPLHERAPDVPAGLALEIDRALSRDPNDRHASMRELGDALESAAIEAGLDVTRRPSARIEIEPASGEPPTVGLTRLPPRSMKRRVVLSIGALVIAAAGAGAILGLTTTEARPPRRGERAANSERDEQPRSENVPAVSAPPSDAAAVQEQSSAGVAPVEVPLPRARPRRPRHSSIPLGANDAPILPIH